MKYQKLLKLAENLVRELDSITDIKSHWTASYTAYQELIKFAKKNNMNMTDYDIEKVWQHVNHTTHLN